jgi:hypothetical protein
VTESRDSLKDELTEIKRRLGYRIGQFLRRRFRRRSPS